MKKTLPEQQYFEKRLKNGFLFNVSTYKKEQEEITGAAMKRSERAIQYLGRLWEGKTKLASTEEKETHHIEIIPATRSRSNVTRSEAAIGMGEQNQGHKPGARRGGGNRARQHTNGGGGQGDGSSIHGRVRVRSKSHTKVRNGASNMTNAEPKRKSHRGRRRK